MLGQEILGWHAELDHLDSGEKTRGHELGFLPNFPNRGLEFELHLGAVQVGFPNHHDWVAVDCCVWG